MRGRPPAWRSLLDRVALGALLAVGFLLAHLPARAGLGVGRRLGDLAWILLHRRRALTLENLERAFGHDQPSAERRRVGRQSFQHLGMNLVEACVFFFRPPAVLLSGVEFHGAGLLRDAAAEGRGVLLLTAHLGNWELLAASHVLAGPPLSVVVRPLDSPVLDRVVSRFRLRGGVELIPKRRGLRGVLDALRRGRMVGLLLDQNASRGEGVFAPLFGVPASTSRSLALLALRTGAPVMPVFIRREPDGRHRVDVEPRVDAPAERSVQAYTTVFNQVIERAIRRSPEQWFWMHDRWKTRPAPETA